MFYKSLAKQMKGIKKLDQLGLNNWQEPETEITEEHIAEIIEALKTMTPPSAFQRLQLAIPSLTLWHVRAVGAAMRVKAAEIINKPKRGRPRKKKVATTEANPSASPKPTTKKTPAKKAK